jgi:hypothetical protein
LRPSIWKTIYKQALAKCLKYIKIRYRSISNNTSFIQQRRECMELAKQPETELEYWGAIENLGGFISSMNRGLSHGRIQDPEGKIASEIVEAGQLSQRLVVELGEKFGVIPPQDCPRPDTEGNYPSPPEGKKYYWPWYQEMKNRAWEMEYEGMICSACPFSKGAKALRISVPCSKYMGVMFYLRAPHLCGMLDVGDWSREHLLASIKDMGAGMVERFLAKEEELKQKPTAS